MPAMAVGQVNEGVGATTVIAIPPANYGSAGWGNVWVSFAAAFGDAHLDVSVYELGSGWKHIGDLLVPDNGNRASVLGGPLPTGTQKVAVKRVADTENVPVSYLVEAVHR